MYFGTDCRPLSSSAPTLNGSYLAIASRSASKPFDARSKMTSTTHQSESSLPAGARLQLADIPVYRLNSESRATAAAAAVRDKSVNLPPIVPLPLPTPSHEEAAYTWDSEEPEPASSDTTTMPEPLQEQSTEYVASFVFQDVVQLLSSICESTRFSDPTVKILSHALPAPTVPGHAYPYLIDAFQSSIPIRPVWWVSLVHAVPGRYFSISDLPAMPLPTTPGPAIGGDSYFVGQRFDSVVPAMEYSRAIPSPNSCVQGLVPPGCQNLSVVERYIPPSDATEFQDMFTYTEPSLLADRMVELSPDNGTLVFVYPTLAGARNFQREFLSPIFDPILRQMQIMHSYTADFGAALGRSNAVISMLTFDRLRSRTARLCYDMSQYESALQHRLGGAKAHFSLIHADTKALPISSKILADWWVRQEKTRLRKQVRDYLENRVGITRPGLEVVDETAQHSGEAVVAELIENFLSNVSKAPPVISMEVAVLVIKRNDAYGNNANPEV